MTITTAYNVSVYTRTNFHATKIKNLHENTIIIAKGNY